MGFELALNAANLGAEVILISGPSSENISHSSVNRIDVVSAEEMFDVVFEHYANVDIAIAAAAVADYTPVKVEINKIKKKEGGLDIKLKATKDVLANMGELKESQFLVGFALETNDEVANAKSKLVRKNLDMIVLNSLRDKGAAFGGDTNKICIIDSSNNIQEYSLKSKEDVASDIFSQILKRTNV